MVRPGPWSVLCRTVQVYDCWDIGGAFLAGAERMDIFGTRPRRISCGCDIGVLAASRLEPLAPLLREARYLCFLLANQNCDKRTRTSGRRPRRVRGASQEWPAPLLRPGLLRCRWRAAPALAGRGSRSDRLRLGVPGAPYGHRHDLCPGERLAGSDRFTTFNCAVSDVVKRRPQLSIPSAPYGVAFLRRTRVDDP